MLRPQSFINFHLPTFDPVDSRIFLIIVRRDGNRCFPAAFDQERDERSHKKRRLSICALACAPCPTPSTAATFGSGSFPSSAPLPPTQPCAGVGENRRINFPWAIWPNFVKFRCGRPCLSYPAGYRAHAQKACVPSFLGRPAHGCVRRISSSPAGPSDIAARLPFLPDQGFRRAQRQ